MTRNRLDNWCEKGMVSLILGILVFGPLATGAVRPLEFLVIQSLTVAVMVLWLARIWINQRYRILWPPICWVVLLFVGYTIVRYQQADIEFVARRELIRVLIYAFLFFAIVNNLKSPEQVKLIVTALLFLGMAVSIYALYQFLTNSDRVWHFTRAAVYAKRGSGTYICPNHLAGFLEMVLPLGLAYIFMGRLPHLARVLWAYASIMILAGIGVTVSRGGWMATGVAVSIFFFVLMRKRQYRISAAIVLVVITGAGVLFYANATAVKNRFNNTISNSAPASSYTRLWLWEPALQMWQDHVWWGVGPGHFDYRFGEYRPWMIQIRPGYAHNDYLNALADWGLVGTSLVAGAWVLLFAGVFQSRKFVSREQNGLGAKASNRAAFVFGASLGLVAILVHSIVDFNMQIPANAIVVVCLMALLSSHLRFATERYWADLGWFGRIIGTAILLAGALYLGQQGWRRCHEYVWLERADKKHEPVDTRIAALKQAASVEPMNFLTTYTIGEFLRQSSWDGLGNHEQLAKEAIQWFERGIRLNRYDPYNYMRIGMCLDLLDRHDEAGRYFQRAVELDPKNHFIVAHQGWHFVQIGNFREAEKWFKQSLELHHAWQNPIARIYLDIVKRKLSEGPANR